MHWTPYELAKEYLNEFLAMDYWSTAQKTIIKIALCQIFIYFRLSAVQGLTHAQSSDTKDIPSPIPYHDVRTTIGVLTVIGILLLCVVTGLMVYCICQPWKRQRTQTSINQPWLEKITWRTSTQAIIVMYTWGLSILVGKMIAMNTVDTCLHWYKC